MEDRHDHWGARDSQVSEALTLFDLREMVVDCLYSTQGPRFGQSRADLGLDAGEVAVRASVEGMVRLAFQTVGGSYDAPTLPTLSKVVNLMAERALGWGAPADEIFKQHCAMTRHIGRFELMQPPGLGAHSSN